MPQRPYASQLKQHSERRLLPTSPHILIVSGFWPTHENEISGIFVVKQLRAFVRAGLRATVILPIAVGKSQKSFLQPCSLKLDPASVRLKIVRCARFPNRISLLRPLFTWILFWTALSLRRCVIKSEVDGDHISGVICHDLRYIAMCADQWTDGLSCPKLAVMHGIDPFNTSKSISHACRSALSRTIPFFNNFVLVGETLRSYADDLGVPRSSQIVVHNGTELPRACEAHGGASEPGRETVILSVSNLVELKGIHDNLVALKILRDDIGIFDWTYRIVGDGPQKRMLQRKAVALGLGGHVRFLGRLDRDSTLQEFDQCDVFSLPSWGDAFGIVYLEAMARGKPTVGCFDAGAAEIIENGHDGFLVPPRAPRELATVLSRMWRDPDHVRAIARRGRDTAERFSWDANVARYLTLLGLRP